MTSSEIFETLGIRIVHQNYEEEKISSEIFEIRVAHAERTRRFQQKSSKSG
jgi:hypothetical protein